MAVGVMLDFTTYIQWLYLPIIHHQLCIFQNMERVEFEVLVVVPGIPYCKVYVVSNYNQMMFLYIYIYVVIIIFHSVGLS